MKEFVSYASEYDLYVGRRSIGELSVQEQDELIKAILCPDGDFRKLVVHKDVKKSQVEGLSSLIVFAGVALEEARQIENFEAADDEDIQKIVAFFSGTKLWLRLEESYPPFNFLEKKTDYDWAELETIRMELLTEAAGEPLYKVKSKICEYLASAPVFLTSEFIDRMSYDAFRQGYDGGNLGFVVDRGLSVRVAQVGLIKRPMLFVLPFVCYTGLLAFVPAWIFFGFWYGLLAFSVALSSKYLTTRMLVAETGRLAISDRQAFRWLLSRRIIHLQNMRS